VPFICLLAPRWAHTLLDFLLKLNLAAKESIESYLRYICGISWRKIQINIAAIGVGDKRPVQELMMPFCSDGSRQSIS
jgi:hypothetical protein